MRDVPLGIALKDIHVPGTEEVGVIPVLALADDHRAGVEGDRGQHAGKLADRIGGQVAERAVAAKEVARDAECREIAKLVREQGLLRDRRAKRLSWKTERADRASGRGVRHPGLIPEDRHLADHRWPRDSRECSQLRAGLDPHFAAQDHERGVGGFALPQDRVACSELHRSPGRFEPGARRKGEGEERSEIQRAHADRG